MVRRSATDKAYAKKFGEKLKAALTKARDNDMSVEAFAESLGVTRAGLHKYRQGRAVPGMPVIEKAKRLYGVDVKYGELDTSAMFRKSATADEKQLMLPLAFETITADHLQVEVGRKTGDYLQLNVKVFLTPAKRRA